MNEKTTFFTIITLICVAVTLLSSNLFAYQTLASFFGFTLFSCFFLLISSFIFFGRKPLILHWNYTLLAFLVWIIYILLHSQIINGHSGNLKDVLIIFSSILFVSISLSVSYYRFSKRWFYIGLMGFILFESFVCFYQVFKGSSLNTHFVVTGMAVNPNITAMFIAMSFPSLWIAIYQEKGNFKVMGFITMLVSLIALILLKSRTGAIGVGVASFIFLYYKYNWTNLLKSKYNRVLFTCVLLLSISLSILFIPAFYHSKKASADGRKTIWKITIEMIKENPFKGYGYGLFDRNFNLYQSKYFEEGRGTKDEILNASYVRMAYNEFLENTVEGGIFGFIIFLGILLSAFLAFFKSKERSLYKVGAFAGACAFGTMSLVNFTIQAIPVFCLFIIYAVIINSPVVSITDSKDTALNKSVKIKPIIQTPIGAVLIFLGLYLGFNQLRLYKGFIAHKKAIILLNNNITEANTILNSLQNVLADCESYYVQSGRGLLLAGNLPMALSSFERATKYTYHPDVFINLGICYEKLTKFSEAEQSYRRAIFIMPNRFTPRYYLMKLYLNQIDTIKALTVAKEIIEMNVKIPSQEVDYMKNEAAKVANIKL